jgi:sugar phosphate isomerase/epimerase
VATLLERVAGAGCGPAVEVIGHQAWPGFPQIGADDERAFRDAVDRLGLAPVALGVYTDLYRRAGRPMTDDEAFADIFPQVAVAARLGFETVRATLGMTPALLRRVLDEAERLGVVLTFEVQGANAPDAAPVVDLLALQQQTGTPHLGLTLDFSLTTPALPEAFGTALRRCGLADDEVERVHDAWAAEGPIGARIGTALAVVRGHRYEGPLSVLVAGVLGRCGRAEAADWAHLLPLVRHAHAKFWDPDVESVRSSHGAWLRALDDAGYTGAVLSEWGGHELLDTADADALEVTRAHIGLLTELAGERTGEKR